MSNEAAKFWSGEARDYNLCTEAEFRDQKAINGWKGLLKQVLGNKEKLKILEVGTGTGFLATLLSQMGHSVEGVDIAKGMLETAIYNTQKRELDVKFHLADAAKLEKFQSNSFDVIVCRHVVWTLPEPDKALAEWYRVLKPEGKLIIFDDNSYNNLKAPFRRIWRIFAWMLIYLSEGQRKPWKTQNKESKIYISDLNYQLRPKEDQKLLKKCGYKILSVDKDISKKVRNFFSYLKGGFWGPIFMIVAQKPLKDIK